MHFVGFHYKNISRCTVLWMSNYSDTLAFLDYRTDWIRMYFVMYSSRCVYQLLTCIIISQRQSQWPRGLRRRSVASLLLRSWIRIPPGAWMFASCECCCVLSGRGLCDELITRPEESYRLWCVIVCDLETSRTRKPWPALGRSVTAKKKKKSVNTNIYWQ